MAYLCLCAGLLWGLVWGPSDSFDGTALEGSSWAYGGWILALGLAGGLDQGRPRAGRPGRTAARVWIGLRWVWLAGLPLLLQAGLAEEAATRMGMQTPPLTLLEPADRLNGAAALSGMMGVGALILVPWAWGPRAAAAECLWGVTTGLMAMVLHPVLHALWVGIGWYGVRAVARLGDRLRPQVGRAG